MDKITFANTVIDRLGGTSETARICDIKPPSVTGWRESGIPKPWEKFLRLAYPAVFADLGGEKPIKPRRRKAFLAA